MKITLVSPYSWTTPGGVNNHIETLAAQLRLRGHEVRILAPSDGPVGPGVIGLGRTLGIPFNGSVARIAFGPRVRNRVRVALRRAQPELIHIHEPFSPSVSLLALQAAKVPVVATFHAAIDSRVYRAAGPYLRRLARKIAIRIAVSRAARDTIESVLGPGARIIPNGLDVSVYAGIEPVNPEAKTVLFFGRLEERKGPQVLLEAIPQVLAVEPDATFVIAGDGPLRRKLEDMVAPEHRASVSFVGSFTDGARSSLLSAASIACLPAIGGESFGIVLLEAMAAGRPVVASAIPGYAAVAEHDVHGFLFSPGDPEALAAALIRLLGDPQAVRLMGEAGRAHAARYDWSVLIGEIEDAYLEALRPTTAR
ncbi:MAG TPA: glycosyltransferase family 4 protein [Actinomycetota bacterium]